MSDVLEWSPPWLKSDPAEPRSVGERAPMRPAGGHVPTTFHDHCIVHPPGFPGLGLEVPHDTTAGIETMVEHALDATVAGIEHSLLDLPTPDSLNVHTLFGPSYLRLVKTGLNGATARGIARWGGAVFFISNHLATAREQLDWHTDRVRATDRHKAKDTIDTRLASRLVGQWGGTEGAQSLRDQVHARGCEPPKPDRGTLNARLAVATLEGRLNYLLLTGGVSSRSAIGLAALLDARGWAELSSLVGCSGLALPVSAAMALATGGKGGANANLEVQAKTWIDRLAHDAVRGLVTTWQTTTGQHDGAAARDLGPPPPIGFG
jgi:hypothetical protein